MFKSFLTWIKLYIYRKKNLYLFYCYYTFSYFRLCLFTEFELRIAKHPRSIRRATLAVTVTYIPRVFFYIELKATVNFR